MSCACGSGKQYSRCCGPYIKGTSNPSTAEKLMRARYTAYVEGAIDFIVSSTIEERRKECDRNAIKEWSEGAKWEGFELIATEKGEKDDTEGVVEFKVYYTENGIKKNYHEKARFKKIDGIWYYDDGEIQKAMPFKRAEEKISRNELCPCGSGKKFKKCCGKI